MRQQLGGQLVYRWRRMGHEYSNNQRQAYSKRKEERKGKVTYLIDTHIDVFKLTCSVNHYDYELINSLIENAIMNSYHYNRPPIVYTSHFEGVRACYFGPPMRPKNENCFSQVSSY